ncbi:MAG: energy transducer TonB [Sphingomicrobium sp.]
MAALALLAAIAAATPPEDTPKRPRLLNVQELDTADDYPRISLKKEQQGTVTARVKVDPDGLVTSCKVTKSSGQSALDEQTCAVLRTRPIQAGARPPRTRGRLRLHP